MSEPKKTPRGHILVGLVLGLGLAILVALVAFGLMSQSNAPLNSDNLNNQSHPLAMGGDKDLNQALHSNIPYPERANGNAAASNNDEASSNSGNKNKDKKHKKADASNQMVEVVDEYGETKLVSRKDLQQKAQSLAEKAKDEGEKIIQKVIGNDERNLEDDTESDAKQADKIQQDPIKHITQKISRPNSEQDTKNQFFIQTGAFKNAEQADQQKATLIMQGLNAKIQSSNSNDGPVLHRVRLGPFHAKEDVARIEKVLQSGDVSYKVIKVSE